CSGYCVDSDVGRRVVEQTIASLQSMTKDRRDRLDSLVVTRFQRDKRRLLPLVKDLHTSLDLLLGKVGKTEVPAALSDLVSVDVSLKFSVAMFGLTSRDLRWGHRRW
ncbi:hypothetical protein PF005_g31944, partial [Phytophthora fragariae]